MALRAPIWILPSLSNALDGIPLAGIPILHLDITSGSGSGPIKIGFLIRQNRSIIFVKSQSRHDVAMGLREEVSVRTNSVVLLTSARDAARHHCFADKTNS